MLRQIAKTLLTGILVALSFPKWNLGPLAWFALVPLFSAIDRKNGKQVFGLGFLSGWAAFLGILYWIVPTFRAAGVSTGVGVLSVALLSAYVALFWSAFAWIFSRLTIHRVFFGASAWAALEWARNYLFTGFPWGSLAYTQWQAWPLIQISEFTGVCGVSFLICAVNIFIYENLVERKIRWVNASVLGLLFSLNFLALKMEQGRETPGKSDLRVAVLQGNIDQYKKWSAESVEEILTSYESLALAPESKSAHLVVWPETALPGWYPEDSHPEDKNLADWLENLIRKTGTFHLVGAVTRSEGKAFNSAFLMSPNGEFIARYDKMHLVPFGEFVPMQSFLGRWIFVLNDLGGFDKGQGQRPLDFNGVRLGAEICYESIFPEIPRAQVKNGAGFLVNLTNDGWYLDTAAPEQHFAMNVFRAVENRRVLVRAANTGISGFIEPTGKIAEKTRLGEQKVIAGNIQTRRDLTLFSRWGDWFPLLCSVFTIWGILIKRKVMP